MRFTNSGQFEPVPLDPFALLRTPLCLQNENKAKRQKLDSAKSLVEQVAAAAKPAFRTLRLGALDSADTANTAMFPQLPAKLQALYFQIASATASAAVDAQVCAALSLHCHLEHLQLCCTDSCLAFDIKQACLSCSSLSSSQGSGCSLPFQWQSRVPS